MTEGFAAIPNWIVRNENVSIWALSTYIALASHSGPGGIHPAQATLAKEARCSERQVRKALNELEELGVVERVRRKSEIGRATNGYLLHPQGRLGADEEALGVTAPHAATSEVTAHGDVGYGTQAHIVPLIEEEPFKKNPEPKRGHRIRPNWEPSKLLLTWAETGAPSVDVVTETAQFVDYWLARSGPTATKVDWDAAWKFWMRRTHQDNVKRGWVPRLQLVDGEEWMER